MRYSETSENTMIENTSNLPSMLSDFHLPGLKEKKVVITAGASGIGFSIARLLHAQGVKVAICDVDADALRRAGTVMEGCPAVEADVSDEKAVDSFFDAVQEKLGGLDALVNNAGIAGPTGNLEDLSPDDWRRCIDICLTGQFLSARRAIPMIKAGGGGALVNMASAAAKHGYAYRTPYSAAKFGVIGLTQSLAKELGPDNIRVNAVLPGIVEGTRMEKVICDRAEATGMDYAAMKANYLNSISMRRMVTPEDVAATVAFLISDAAVNLSGQSLAVDGNIEKL